MQSTEILLRKPDSDEFKEIAKFSFENFVAETAKASGQSTDKLKANLGSPPSKIHQNDIWYVIECMKQQAGFLWIQLDPHKKEAFGYDIYLNPTYRSKGIGRIVMQKCKVELKNLGYNSVSICVFEENKIARNLYETLGFKSTKFDESRKQLTLTLEF